MAQLLQVVVLKTGTPLKREEKKKKPASLLAGFEAQMKPPGACQLHVAIPTVVSVFIILEGSGLLFCTHCLSWNMKTLSVSFSSAFHNMAERSVEQALLEKCLKVGVFARARSF